jgi:hypothetical protein
MLDKQPIPAATAGVYTNGQTPAGKTVKAQQRRALRKLIRDLVAFTGTAINDLAAAPRKAPQPKRERLLYRRADTLSDGAVERIVFEIGPERVLRVVDKYTSPKLPLVVAE